MGDGIPPVQQSWRQRSGGANLWIWGSSCLSSGPLLRRMTPTASARQKRDGLERSRTSTDQRIPDLSHLCWRRRCSTDDYRPRKGGTPCKSRRKECISQHPSPPRRQVAHGNAMRGCHICGYSTPLRPTICS